MDDDKPLIDPELKRWASDEQKAKIDAVNLHRGYRNAARALGMQSHTPLIRSVQAVQRKAAGQGYSPAHDMVHDVPAPMVLKGTSTLYGRDGAVKLQWVKSTRDADMAEQAIRDFITDLTEDVRGKSVIPPIPPWNRNEHLLTVYPIGDPHFGMYAWKDEAGDDFDLDIAERITNAAMDSLVEEAPAGSHALILNLGDMFHADNESNMTTRSHNALDVDTRYQRVMRIGLRSMIHCIRQARRKHSGVTFRINKGNHDEHSSFALALALDAYFANDADVTIDLSPAVHWYYRFGKVLIGSTHGDRTKAADLPGVMASDQRTAWGECAYCYWYNGHIHHDKVQEYPGVMVEYFRTLAAKDAWHAGQGYRSGRDMQAIIHHREFGEIGRHRRGIAMIDPQAVAA